MPYRSVCVRDDSGSREILPSASRRSGRRAASAAGVALVAAALLWPASLATSTAVEAKTPGKTYCFLGKCHRVRTLAETQSLVGRPMTVRASHYDDARRDRFNPSNITSSGEYFRAGAADNAASPNLPNGTVILAYNPSTRQAAVLRINNAGPYWGNRTLDVSRGAAQRLGFAGQGVASLVIKVVRAPTQSEATYSRGRRYAAVPGPIGSHGSVQSALAEARRRMGGAAPSTPVPVPASSGTLVASAPKAKAAPVRVAAARPAARSAPVTTATTAPSTPAVASPAQTVAAPAPLAQRPARTQATRVAARSSLSAPATGRRPAMDAQGYFRVDCRSMPEVCAGSGGRSFRTSDASGVVSNRP